MSKITSKEGGISAPGATNASSGACPRDNEELRAKYDEMHAQGVTSWFSDGREERGTILKMGEPWDGLSVMEIGCGEGDLTAMINLQDANCLGVDYSQEAICKAKLRHGDLNETEGVTYLCANYRDTVGNMDRIVMQGVLEHLDDPFGELQWMIEHFQPKTVITSSPCFLNPRGIVWMTLHMLGAVMSKTDLHFLDPIDFERFCMRRQYRLTREHCDWDWGNGLAMMEDLRQRIPLALTDGELPVPDSKTLDKFLDWLIRLPSFKAAGATMVYRIDL